MALHFLVSEDDRKTIGVSDLLVIEKVYSREAPITEIQVELELVGLEHIRTINHQYRHLDEPTDVLSFPTTSSREEIKEIAPETPLLLGSIIICPEKAAIYGETLPQLVHHGLLHLFSYDHERDLKEWQEKEAAILHSLATAGLTIPGIPNAIL